MSQFRNITVTQAELDLSRRLPIAVEVRTEVIQRWKDGQTFTQIADAMQLKRSRVRKIVDPDYDKPAEKRSQQAIARERGYQIDRTTNRLEDAQAQPVRRSEPDGGRLLRPTLPGPEEIMLQLPKGRGDKPPQHKPTQRERAILSEQEKKFDEAAVKEQCVDDLRRVQEENPTGYINRNMYRHLGKYSDATWSQFFGSFLEFRRQAKLELSRGQHAHERQIAKHASLDVYREFYAKEIEPLHLLYPRAPKTGINTIACISDNHDRMQDPFVWRVFCETLKLFNPDVILFNGDQADAYEFNKYGIDPRIADAVAALHAVRSMFAEARSICPDSEILWNLGNHEWRLQKHMAEASPYMRSVLGDFHGWGWAELFGVKDLQVNINCKWDLAAYNKFDTQLEVKNNWIVLWETFVAMHTHDDKFGISGTSGHMHTKGGIGTAVNMASGKRSPHNWTVTPPACRGNAEYELGLDKSSQGFALFHIMPDKGITVPELVLIQGDFAAVAGRYYYRQPDEVYMPTQTSWVL